MTYTADEIRAYAQSFARRILAGDESAYFELSLFLEVLGQMQWEAPQ